MSAMDAMSLSGPVAKARSSRRCRGVAARSSPIVSGCHDSVSSPSTLGCVRVACVWKKGVHMRLIVRASVATVCLHAHSLHQA